MKERFEGPDGRRRLIESLMGQKLVSGNVALATELADSVELLDIEVGQKIISLGDEAIDIFLILTGSFNIEIKGKIVATRTPGDHVGEMAAIQPSQMRSANVIAAEKSVVAKFTEPVLDALGTKYPCVWRSLAKEMARRLEQRNSTVTPRHDKVRVFVMSSVEGIAIARALKAGFNHDPFEVIVWDQGVFLASQYPLESLEKVLDICSFGIAIGTPDDEVTARERTSPALRDNVIFELGYFMGRLGRDRTFLVEPRREGATLPSDLKGINTVDFKFKPGDNIDAAIGNVCEHLRRIVARIGPF